MKKIEIQTESSRYPVYIGEGAIEELSTFLKNQGFGLTKIMVITDESVAELHLPKLKKELAEYDYSVFIAPRGEKAKTLQVYYDSISEALGQGMDRKSLIVAFGGGAVGDLAGFAAATYMRGIRFIQLPTTILAHDSSVGGKTGINHPLGKNMIGAFHQPEAVFYDLNFLGTLPSHEVRSGFAEVIKHSLIGNLPFYSWLREQIVDLENLSTENLALALEKGILVKKEVVSRDERENGIRAYLNFGHTLGHAIEAEMGYGTITHGEAVMIGMCFALELSIEHAGLTFDLVQFKQWIERLGYNSEIPPGLSKVNLLKKMKQDKKGIAGEVRFVLLEQVGKPVIKIIEENILSGKLK